MPSLVAVKIYIEFFYQYCYDSAKYILNCPHKLSIFVMPNGDVDAPTGCCKNLYLVQSPSKNKKNMYSTFCLGDVNQGWYPFVETGRRRWSDVGWVMSIRVGIPLLKLEGAGGRMMVVLKLDCAGGRMAICSSCAKWSGSTQLFTSPLSFLITIIAFNRFTFDFTPNHSICINNLLIFREMLSCIYLSTKYFARMYLYIARQIYLFTVSAYFRQRC
jgi:hypothetical protein